MYIFYEDAFLRRYKFLRDSTSIAFDDTEVWSSIARHVHEHRYGNIDREDHSMRLLVFDAMKTKFQEYLEKASHIDGVDYDKWVYKRFLEWSISIPEKPYLTLTVLQTEKRKLKRTKDNTKKKKTQTTLKRPPTNPDKDKGTKKLRYNGSSDASKSFLSSFLKKSK